MPLDLVNEILKHVDESVVVIGQSQVTAAKESLNSQKKVVRSLAFFLKPTMNPPTYWQRPK